MIRTALIAAIAAIASSTALADQAEGIATAKHAVATTLRDPASARFEDVRARLDAVCGFVNAKNGPGGYAGRALFVYDVAMRKAFVLDPALTVGPTYAAAAIAAYEKHCQ